MLSPIRTYENSYFKIRVNFPPGWEGVDWQNRNVTPESLMRDTFKRDDLPKENGEYIFLLSATCHFKEGPSMTLGPRFSIVVHRRTNGFDLFNETKEKSDLVNCEFKRTHIFERDVQIIKTVQPGSDCNVISKVVAWEDSPEIWLSVCIYGESLQKFLAAEEVLNSIETLRGNQ